MNLNGLIGRKIDQSQRSLEDGTRVPVTVVEVGSNIIAQLKTVERDGYQAVQLGFGIHKNAKNPQIGHIKKAGKEKAPRFLREIRVESDDGLVAGSDVALADVFKPGDIIDVTGRSKGKGYAGVVKRHHFKGGPRTHGQSDRERAPGSIGQTTTPGRVYKGKRMSGKMGDAKSTIKNLVVLDVEDGRLIVKGLIPGVRGGFVFIRKTGEDKKFKQLFKLKEEVVIKAETLVGVVSESTDVIEETVSVKQVEEVEEKKEEVEAKAKNQETVKEEDKKAVSKVDIEKKGEKVLKEIEKKEEAKDGGK